MKQITYLEIIKQAAKITWQNKFLWVFGFLILLGSLFSNVSWSANSESKEAKVISDFIQKNPNIFLIILIGVLFLMLIFFILKIAGTVALVKSANNIAVYKQTSIRNILSETKKYISPLVLLEITIGLSLLVVIFVLAIPVIYLYAVKAWIFFAISMIFAIVIFISLIITAYFLRCYAYFFIILSDVKFMLALEMGYSLFKKNLKESLLMGCISLAVNTLSASFLLIFIIIAALIFLVPIAIAYFLFAEAGVIVAAIIGGIFILGFMAFIFSPYFVFIQTMWLLFFKEITLEKKEEKNAFEKTEAVEKIPDPETV